MQLLKMSTRITPAKRKKIVPLSSVLDMLEDSPSKRPRLSNPEIDKKTPVKIKPKHISVRRSLNSAISEDEDTPTFEIRSFYNSARHHYLSPIHRKGVISSSESKSGEFMPNGKVLSKSAGPKIPGRNKPSRFATNRKTSKVRKRLTIKEKQQNSEVDPSTKLHVEKSAHLPTKNELTFKINMKTTSTSSSPVFTPSLSKVIANNSAYEYDFDEALTWDVENLAPASCQKKFFKNQPSPGAKVNSKMESSTTLVVKRGFNLKFLHHRGEQKTSANIQTSRRTSMPEKISTPPHKNRLSCPQKNDDDDAMMKKLREELMNECEHDEFAFVSSSDESVHHEIPDNRTEPTSPVRGKSTENTDSEMTPDLFSQSPLGQRHVVLQQQTTIIKDMIISEKKTPPSSDSACHTGHFESSKTSDELMPYSRESPVSLEGCPSSPSRNSEVSSNPSDDTESLSSYKSGPSQRKKLSIDEKDAHKYFPIFSRSNTPKTTTVTKIFKSTDSPGGRKRLNGGARGSPNTHSSKGNMEQMFIDAGQSMIGVSQCEVCGMIYTPGESADEGVHAKFHQHLLAALRFPGWKKERVLQEYPEDGGRVLLVTPEDPKYAVKKVEDINKVMAQELGFSDSSLSFQSSYKVFLYISDEKKVVGCCVAEPVSVGYRVIPDTKSSSGSTQSAHRPWCCETTPSPAAVGISRIWVYRQNRREGIATRLLEAVRHWFEYGSLIHKDMMAFSDPTPDGKQFGERYTGKPNFLVYKYNAI